MLDITSFYSKIFSALAEFIVFIDAALGMILYVLISLIFHEPFSSLIFFAAIFFAFFPDLDVIPFLVLRKRLKLVSHHIIHFPTLLIPIGAFLVYLTTQSLYLTLLFAAGVTAHFLHDSIGVNGIRWFWPLSSTAYQLKIRFACKQGVFYLEISFDIAREREAFYAGLRKDMAKRSIKDEIMMRMEKLDAQSVIFLSFGILLTLFFALRL